MGNDYDLAVIGGGPAGMAAALAAKKNGVENIIIFERDRYLGGILPQCIHNGFGLEYFDTELTGPEYAARFIEETRESGIDILLETMVMDISRDKVVTALNRSDGILKINVGAVFLAMGCRERTRENLKIPGNRPAGVLTAGTAQRYTNIEGYIPGKKVIILGSGDIGLIMARRMTLEGAEVKSVLELLPFVGGLIRNKVQCLDDFDIPLHLQHTITRIEGEKRVERVKVAEVDDNLQVIPGKEKWIDCDTVLLSVGLIPENELTKGMGLELDQRTGGPIVNEARETEIEGVFAAGNVLHVHDLVDWVTEESEIAGQAIAKYLTGSWDKRKSSIEISPGNNVNYVIPNRIELVSEERKFVKLFLRVNQPLTDVRIIVENKGEELVSFKRDFAFPGEMLNIILPEKTIKPAVKKLIVSVVRQESGGNDEK
ncbi:MAG: NAD(P)/FAD-dependent oxidoreductase [Halanaerobiaceae bacterium]